MLRRLSGVSGIVPVQSIVTGFPSSGPRCFWSMGSPSRNGARSAPPLLAFFRCGSVTYSLFARYAPAPFALLVAGTTSGTKGVVASPVSLFTIEQKRGLMNRCLQLGWRLNLRARKLIRTRVPRRTCRPCNGCFARAGHCPRACVVGAGIGCSTLAGASGPNDI